MGDVILGRRSNFPKLDVKTVEIPDESVNDDLFPLFLSFHGLNLKHRATKNDRDHATHAAESEHSEDDEGGDAAEEEHDVAADNEVDQDMFDMLAGTRLPHAHRRPW